MSVPNNEFLTILKLSAKEMQTEMKRLQALPNGPDSPVGRFWLRDGVREEKLRSNAEVEARRTSDASRLHYSHLAKTFSQHMHELEQRLHEEAVKLGSHAEVAVKPDVPSRCRASGDFTLTELQRAAQRLFEPGCPPPMRRIMTELTPGMGKTCIYMEVIAKFLGKRNPETGEFFDIIILGDDEVFSAFNSLRSCPAAVNLEEIVKFNQNVLGTKEDQLVGEVLYKRSSADPYPAKQVRLSSVNRTEHDTPLCALNTRMEESKGARSKPAARKKKGAGGGSEGGATGGTLDPCEPGAAEKASPLESRKSSEQCGDEAWIWRGTRVIMLPYAVAAKWVVFSGKGLPVLDNSGQPIAKEAVKSTEAAFLSLQGKLEQFTARELGKGAQGLLGALGTATSVYRPKGLNFQSSNTLFILDEVQNLSTPSTWGKNHEARPYSPALSEALWRCTGDFCDDTAGGDCADGVRQTPYIFAGTATPNTGTNPESTICLMQILNGKQRGELFVPRWGNDAKEAEYTDLPARSLKQYRELLRSGDNRFTKKLVWPPYAERRAKDLVVYPRTFLEAESGFVEDVTRGERSTERFPLLDPQTRRGVVRGWRYDKTAYSYGQAARRVLEEKLLPEDSEDVSKLGAYRPHDLEKKRGTLLMHDLAYKSFICAAREEDLRFQRTRIYRPIYGDELNRRFLQDMVATRVFTANSYFDYRVYPEVAPSTMQGDLAQPLTRIVVPKYALRCLPRARAGRFEPDLMANVKLLPRLKAELDFPSADVQTREGPRRQYPWFVPGDAAASFLKHLETNRDRAELKECRWSEWSLCADLLGMKKLCSELFESYRRDQHLVDLQLEDKLRDFCARNCPKLVVAADDLYHAPQDANIFLPELSTEAKTFFFMNATNRKVLNSNYFIVLASFYFRMRCRPFLQHFFAERQGLLPHQYRGGQCTVQHRIAWLDALLLEGSDLSLLAKFPPCNIFDNPRNKTQPDAELWRSFWLDWMKGHRSGRGVPPMAGKTLPPRKRSPLLKKSPLKPPASSAAEAFRTRQRKQALDAAAAARQLAEWDSIPEEDRDKDEVRRLGQKAKTTFFQRFRKVHRRRRSDQREVARRAYFIPAIFALGDAEMEVAEEQKLHHNLYCNFMDKLQHQHAKMPLSWTKHQKDCKAAPLKIEDLVQIMGSPGFRLAMTKAMDEEPCVRGSSAGQSMVFAGLAAHKALDFKCTGLNVAFGPQPRGQRIQEMGRNWRTCVNLPHVAIRQIFLDGDERILKNDLLLDSFYQAQNEVLEWLRTITISAGLGCSLWWGYSQWAKLLSSYHDMRPVETEWFFGKGAEACMDARASSQKPSLLTWHKLQKHDADAGFFRCRRTDTTSVVRLHETGKNVGEIVPSPVGAFSPEEIVADPHARPIVQDPSCSSGSAVDLRTPRSASVKYCLSRRDSMQLNPPPARPPAPLQLERHFMGPKEQHFHSARRDREKVRAQPASIAGLSTGHDELLSEAPLRAARATAPLPFGSPPTAAHAVAPHPPKVSPGADVAPPGPGGTGFLRQPSSSASRLPVFKGKLRSPSPFRLVQKGILKRPSSPVSPQRPA